MIDSLRDIVRDALLRAQQDRPAALRLAVTWIDQDPALRVAVLEAVVHDAIVSECQLIGIATGPARSGSDDRVRPLPPFPQGPLVDPNYRRSAAGGSAKLPMAKMSPPAGDARPRANIIDGLRAVAADSWSDLLLQCGVPLREATQADVLREADYYRRVAREHWRLGKFMMAVADRVPKGDIVGDVCTESDLQQLFERTALISTPPSTSAKPKDGRDAR